MGSPQERPGPLTEKRVEISLGNGVVRIPFHFGRQPASSDAMRARLDELLLAGAKVFHPSWVEKDDPLTDDEIREELKIEARHPEARAPLMVLGLVSSQDGFVKFDRPFNSLSDPKLRESFSAIVDTLVGLPTEYYSPASIARNALFMRNVPYEDGQQRDWGAGEVQSHLTIALAERGKIFNTKYDEHSPRIMPHFRWPADLAELLGIAYLLGEEKIEGDQLKSRVEKRMRENLTSITDLARLSEEDQAHIVTQANSLAGAKVLAS